MRCLTRIGLALLGLCVAVPPASQAGAPFMKGSYAPPNSKLTAKDGVKPRAPEGPLCTECQRAQLAAKGIMVPPAPPVPDGIVMGTQPCTRCQRPAAITMTARPRTSAPMAASVNEAPGLAYAGGETPFPEPAPVGVMRTNYVGSTPGLGTTADRTPKGPIPAAPTPMGDTVETRPHIVAHLFGISAWRRSNRERWEARGERKREAHAALSYGADDKETVADLPSSMVYGRR